MTLCFLYLVKTITLPCPTAGSPANVHSWQLLQAAGNSNLSGVGDGGDDAELQLLIQQQRVALRHLEALTARRTQQRAGAALSPVPQRSGPEWGRSGGRSSTPVPDSSLEPVPQRGFSSRATTPVPSSSPGNIQVRSPQGLGTASHRLCFDIASAIAVSC